MALKVNAGIVGQSNGKNYNLVPIPSTLTPSPLVKYWNGAIFDDPVDGNGQIALGNALAAALGAEINIINGASNAVSVLAAAEAQLGPDDGYWLDFATAGEPYRLFEDMVAAAGVTLDLIIFIGFENEVLALDDEGITQNDLVTGLQSFFAELRADFGTSLPIVITPLADITGFFVPWPPATETEKTTVRDAQAIVAEADSLTFIGAQNTDIPLDASGLHYTAEGYTTHGTRAAAAAIEALSDRMTMYIPLNSDTSLAVGSGSGTHVRSTVATYMEDGILKTALANVTRFEDGWEFSEGPSTNDALHNRDLSDAVWVGSILVFPADGLDGEAGTASALVGSGTDSTKLQTITQVSAENTYSVDVKRLNGVGTIEITDDGTTWIDITSLINTETYTRFELDPRTQANPVIGFRINIDTDSIAADYNQLEEMAFATSRIGTGAAPVSRAGDSLAYPTAGNIPTSGKAQSLFVTIRADNYHPDDAQTIFSFNSTSWRMWLRNSSSSDARAVVGSGVADGLPYVVGSESRLGYTVAADGEGNLTTYTNGVEANDDENPAMASIDANMLIGLADTGVDVFYGHIKNLRAYNYELTPQQVMNEGLENQNPIQIALYSDVFNIVGDVVNKQLASSWLNPQNLTFEIFQVPESAQAITGLPGACSIAGELTARAAYSVQVLATDIFSGLSTLSNVFTWSVEQLAINGSLALDLSGQDGPVIGLVDITAFDVAVTDLDSGTDLIPRRLYARVTGDVVLIGLDGVQFTHDVVAVGIQDVGFVQINEAGTAGAIDDYDGLL